MSPEAASEVKLEIGHVLFLDVVGYSKLLITQQSEQLEILRKIARATEQFRSADAEGKLLRLPTGDGGALVFRTTPEAPVLCALEIARELKKHPELRVRMGIHSGPVNAITDLNEQANIAGAGINTAQRVMDCGDAGHILVSKHVAEDLEHYPRWRPYLHELGACEVKHGVRVSVVNFYTDEVGNPALPEKFRSEPTVVAELEPKRSKPILPVAIGIAALAVLAILAALILPGMLRSRDRAKNERAEALPAVAKSIAVLPFENLSRDPDNAYFVEGIQDEILTRLSKIAALKVISRTSTQKYKSVPDNLREVGRQLGVANLLEGSVQRIANAVHVNVQLIRCSTDEHLWAESYNRKLDDVFGDPQFAEAWAALSRAQSQMFFHYDKTASRRDSAQNALKEALRLQPGLADTQLARGYFQYWVEHDYEGALTLMQQLRTSLPNNAEILQVISFISARLGKWQDSVDAIKKALELNPRDLFTHIQAEHILMATRDFPGVTQMVDNALQIWPNNSELLGYKAFALQAAGRLDDAQSVLNSLAPNLDENDSSVSALWVQARLRRSPEAAIKAFAPHIQNVGGDKIQLLLLYGDLLDLTGRKAEAETALAEAKDKFEAQLRSQPDNDEIIGPTAYAYAWLGQRDAAEKALDNFKALAWNDARATGTFEDLSARIMARFGKKDEAISSLQRVLSQPCDGITGMPPTPALLRLDPDYDSLRGDPRFEKLCQERTK